MYTAKTTERKLLKTKESSEKLKRSSKSRKAEPRLMPKSSRFKQEVFNHCIDKKRKKNTRFLIMRSIARLRSRKEPKLMVTGK